MHYSKLLRILCSDKDLKRAELINQLPDYTLAEIKEEIEYTMMAGWVVENTKGFTLTHKWKDQNDDQKYLYLNRKDRPELINPIDVGAVTGVLIRQDYAWTKLNWHTFNYRLLGEPEIEDQRSITNITGLFQGELWFELKEVKTAIEQAASQWYKTFEGAEALTHYRHGLNLEQLVNYIQISYELESTFKSCGVQNLKITHSLTNSNWQETTIMGQLY